MLTAVYLRFLTAADRGCAFHQEKRLAERAAGFCSEADPMTDIAEAGVETNPGLLERTRDVILMH